MKLSKSKLALAKVINENGGWPQDSEWAVQNGVHGRIGFSINKPARHDGKSWATKGGFNFKIEVCKPLKNWHQNVLSREEYYHAYPKSDADGWIEWNGGRKSPVGDGVLVDVRLKSGTYYEAELLDDTSWPDTWGDMSIVAYRLHKPEVKPEFCESVTRSIPDPELDDVGSQLASALELVKAAAPHLLSDKYKFHGEEVMGGRKPTIEQMVQDYRNAKRHAERLRKEAGDAAVKSESFAVEIRKKILELQELIVISKPDQEPELVITDWRKLRDGDVVEITGSDNGCWKEHDGMEMTVENVYPDDSDYGNQVDLLGESGSWCLGGNTTWRFIRRP